MEHVQQTVAEQKLLPKYGEHTKAMARLGLRYILYEEHGAVLGYASHRPNWLKETK